MIEFVILDALEISSMRTSNVGTGRWCEAVEKESELACDCGTQTAELVELHCWNKAQVMYDLKPSAICCDDNARPEIAKYFAISANVFN